MANLTMLEKYQIAYAELAKQGNSMTLEQAWTMQELLYRMEVLQACQMFTLIAPVGGDMRAMLTHYQMVDGYLESLKTERRNGLASREEEQKQRDTAHQNLCRIVNDYRKRFSSFSPTRPEQYKSEITRAITTFLPAWVQSRNTFIKITTKEAQK